MIMTMSGLPELHEKNQEILGRLILMTMAANGFTVANTHIEFTEGEA